MGKRVPSYRLHKPTGQAFIEIRGKRKYLGKHGTPESRQRYSRELAEHMAGLTKVPADTPTLVASLIRQFWRHVKQRYVKNGRPTSEQNRFKLALREVRKLYGETPAADFGPIRLMAVRKKFVDRKFVRKQINLLVSRIRRCWKWGVSRELVPETTWRALMSVEGLRKGEARDNPPVEPVSIESVNGIKDQLSPVLWAMVQFQWLTGCRPGEVCSMRMCDLRMQGDVWEYHPESHKTEHHGKQRIIFIGPQAQLVLRLFLRTDTMTPLFRPRDSRIWYLSEGKKSVSPSKSRVAFSSNTYGQAIRKACRRAGVAAWTPNQLRHAAATRIRSQCDIDASRVVLGHTEASTTEIYAAMDFNKAREIMKRLG